MEDMTNIPEELILKILLCLPVKSLIRFKCVSRPWLSLIFDPHFGKSHFQRSAHHPHRILHRAGLNIQSIDIDSPLHEDSAAATLSFPLPKPPLHNLDIMCSCRGFLLLVLKIEKKLFVWNPSTSFCKHIPLSHPWNFIVLYGFCYDESTDDYLVIVASFDGKPSGRFEVFSMRKNSWKKLALNCRLISGATFTSNGWILNGAIHWLIWRLDLLQNHDILQPRHGSGVVAFDIEEKNLRDVPPPDDIPLKYCDLGVLGGCLALTEKKTSEVKIWVMREYGVQSSWTKLISVSRCRSDMRYILPVCFTKDGQLVAVDGRVGLSKWSDKGEMIEHRHHCHHHASFWGSAIVYTETLLSLP